MARKKAQAKQAKSDSRSITVHAPFDYVWSRLSMTRYPAGEFRVKNEVADFATGKGYASEGKQESSTAKTADDGSADVVDHANDADTDRPADGPAVDHDAG